MCDPCLLLPVTLGWGGCDTRLRPPWWTEHDEELLARAVAEPRQNPGILPPLRVCRLCCRWDSGLGYSGRCELATHWRQARHAQDTCPSWQGFGQEVTNG